ncbi:MAG: crossover junction endodeoxyribonuclease RuvC, partial [Planctomycetota bacterium]
MTETSEALPTRIRVLGVDPGTRTLGYGVLDVAPRGKLDVVECGVVRLPPKPLEVRLEAIFRDVGEIILRREPDVLAIEDVFGGKNFRSALKVGEARGVVVLAAQRSGLKICEYAPAFVKRAATGNGAADKRQVQKAMVRLLRLPSAPEPTDVTDALAVAFCHARGLWRPGPTGAPRGGAAAG